MFFMRKFVNEQGFHTNIMDKIWFKVKTWFSSMHGAIEHYRYHYAILCTIVIIIVIERLLLGYTQKHSKVLLSLYYGTKLLSHLNIVFKIAGCW